MHMARRTHSMLTIVVMVIKEGLESQAGDLIGQP